MQIRNNRPMRRDFAGPFAWRGFGAWARRAVAAALLMSSNSASAHDFWIEPETFTPRAETPLEVRLRVGHEDELRSVARKPERIIRFEAVDPAGRAVAITGEAGQEPAGRVILSKPGVHTLVFQSNHAYIELEADKFDDYLEHEGLTEILAGRRASKRGPGRESYARYCKSLVRVGESEAGFDRTLGLPLELTALASPFDGPLRFRLDFRGQPLAGARVELMRLDNLTQSQTSKTNAKGEVRFEKKRLEPGAHMVAVTHMVPAKPPVKGEWESFWGTLSFELPSAQTQNEY